MNYRSDKLMIDGHTDTYTHTHAGNDNTRRPKLASGKNQQISIIHYIWWWYIILYWIYFHVREIYCLLIYVILR